MVGGVFNVDDDSDEHLNNGECRIDYTETVIVPGKCQRVAGGRLVCKSSSQNYMDPFPTQCRSIGDDCMIRIRQAKIVKGTCTQMTNGRTVCDSGSYIDPETYDC
jgi:hypothetical protein